MTAHLNYNDETHKYDVPEFKSESVQMCTGCISGIVEDHNIVVDNGQRAVEALNAAIASWNPLIDWLRENLTDEQNEVVDAHVKGVHDALSPPGDMFAPDEVVDLLKKILGDNVDVSVFKI